MLIDVNGDALRLLEHFLQYGKTHTCEVADAMYYDYDGFKDRLNKLQKAFDQAKR